MRILLTTTSYQDTPGRHHQVLEQSGFEVVLARGPLPEADMLKLIEESGGVDGLLNGDDEITARFIDAGLAAATPLKVIAKYGIGLDSIDVAYATQKKIPVLFTPGVNHTTVAEHAIALMIGASKHFWHHLKGVKDGEWKKVRKTGNELAGKTLGVLGMGRIGKEVVKRASAFDMACVAFDVYWDDAFAEQHNVKREATMEDVLKVSDVISLHMPATDETRQFINTERIAMCKEGVIIVNTARGKICNRDDIADALK